MRIIPFLNSFSPVLFSLVKQSNRLPSQHQNLRYFYYVLMDLEQRKIYLRRCKYCERKPRILKPELTENVSRYASLHYLSKPPKDEKNKVPKIAMGKILDTHAVDTKCTDKIAFIYKGLLPREKI